MTNNTNQLDLKTFVIKFIAFHLKFWKLFAIALVIGIIPAIYLITRPLKTVYQHHILFAVGELPPNIVAQCVYSFSYDSIGREFGNYSVSVNYDYRKKGTVEAILTTNEKIDLQNLVPAINDYVKNCGLVKGFQQANLEIKNNLIQQLKGINIYYKKIDSLRVPDKGYVYGAVYAREIDLKKDIAKVKMFDVNVSNYYTITKQESKGKRYVKAVGIILVLFALVYIYLFFRLNAEEIKNEIKNM